MYCTNCGKEIYESICPNCGNNNDEVIEPEKNQLKIKTPNNIFSERQISIMNSWQKVKEEKLNNISTHCQSENFYHDAKDNKNLNINQPISMWGYFAYDILFTIPIIGWIINIIFAIGATNLNLKNYARSKFCLMIIYFVLFLIFFGGLSSIFSSRYL